MTLCSTAGTSPLQQPMPAPAGGPHGWPRRDSTSMAMLNTGLVAVDRSTRWGLTPQIGMCLASHVETPKQQLGRPLLTCSARRRATRMCRQMRARRLTGGWQLEAAGPAAWPMDRLPLTHGSRIMTMCNKRLQPKATLQMLQPRTARCLS